MRRMQNPDAIGSEPTKTVYGWLPISILAGSSVLISAWLLWPGTRVFPEESPLLNQEQSIAILEDTNRALQQKADALRAALDGAMCREDGVFVMPDGNTIFGTPAPETFEPLPQEARGKADSLLPPPIAGVIPETEVGKAEPGSLLDVLQKSTVMVIADGSLGSESGTGFFVDAQHIVTNHHVVTQSGPDAQVYVTNRALGGVRRAEIIALDGPMDEVGADFALLKIDSADGHPFPIRSSAVPLTLQNVVASGFPGDVMDMDTEYRALKAGDASAVPTLTVTDGIVNTEQLVPPRMRLVIHSAPISTGNSGGPLTDMCGNVVGVNTFVQTGELRTLNFAQASISVIEFVERAGLAPSKVSENCKPLLSNSYGDRPPSSEEG